MAEVRLLAALSNASGPPGTENEVRELLRKELEAYADEVKEDRLGSILFYQHGRGDRPKVMLAAHMDEVAFMVTFIEENGFLRFATLGGITNNIMPGQAVVFRGARGPVKGIIGTKPPHLMKEEERNKVLAAEDLFIDIGAENMNEARKMGIDFGSTGVFDTSFTELGSGYLRGKALDDRAGCTVLAETFKALRGQGYNLTAAGTVQEEMGLRGARTAAWQVEPDYALALEGTFAADVPDTRQDRTSAKLKGGPVITIVDGSVITHPVVLKTLTTVANAKGVPYQFKKVPVGGTDAGAIHLTRAGVPSGTIAVPCRYIHGPASIAHIDDVRNTIALATEFVKAISEK